jgi:hypothetical protein
MLTIAAVAIDTLLDADERVKALAAARVTFAVIAVACAAPLLLKVTDVRATNLDRIAAFVGKHATADDLVIVWPMTDGATFKRYLQQPVSWLTIPNIPNVPAQPGDDVLQPYEQPNSLQPTLDRVEATLRNGGRVWLASTWPLELYNGVLRPVVPFDKKQPRTIGYFLRGWGYHLAATLQAHASEGHRVALPEDQAISIYEHSSLSVFSGWKETTTN